MVKRSSCKTDHRITVILYSDNSDSTVLFFSITLFGNKRVASSPGIIRRSSLDKGMKRPGLDLSFCL